jgi:hypothetical protein
MLRYNRTNSSEMIVNIQRAFTTSPTTCDYEIDVFSKDPVKTESGNTIPFLEENITQIVMIDEIGTKVRVASSTGFSKGMTVDVRYTITNTITYMINSANRSESLAPYNPTSSTRSISQAIQGLRVVTSVDVSNSIHYITYSNDIDKTPLNIYYYPINDVKRDLDVFLNQNNIHFASNGTLTGGYKNKTNRKHKHHGKFTHKQKIGKKSGQKGGFIYGKLKNTSNKSKNTSKTTSTTASLTSSSSYNTSKKNKKPKSRDLSRRKRI